ncbi:hypothetical protein B0H17DRAFT_1131676 [Mycena rosella]|uniref:Uncharacterized protein n=1 Tax=Mycena rosella TaxID=1033263 RepID=A0AAD7DPP9_MYCRO|nr:hypothetical protein B0H17DRAFT_1131676 [Mycena rosella]
MCFLFFLPFDHAAAVSAAWKPAASRKYWKTETHQDQQNQGIFGDEWWQLVGAGVKKFFRKVHWEQCGYATAKLGMSRGPKGYTMGKNLASGRFGSCSKQVVTKQSAPYDKEDNVVRLIQTTLAVVGGTVDEGQGHQSRPGDLWDQPESGLLEELLWLEGSSMLAASVKTLKSRKLEGCVITRLKLESQFRDTTGRESTAVLQSIQNICVTHRAEGVKQGTCVVVFVTCSEIGSNVQKGPIACLSDLSKSNKEKLREVKKKKLRELKWKKKTVGTQLEEKKVAGTQIEKKLWELNKKKKLWECRVPANFLGPPKMKLKHVGTAKRS